MVLSADFQEKFLLSFFINITPAYVRLITWIVAAVWFKNKDLQPSKTLNPTTL